MRWLQRCHYLFTALLTLVVSLLVVRMYQTPEQLPPPKLEDSSPNLVVKVDLSRPFSTVALREFGNRCGMLWWEVPLAEQLSKYSKVSVCIKQGDMLITDLYSAPLEKLRDDRTAYLFVFLSSSSPEISIEEAIELRAYVGINGIGSRSRFTNPFRGFQKRAYENCIVVDNEQLLFADNGINEHQDFPRLVVVYE